MANYRTEWQAISERIEGLLRATEVTQLLCQGHTHAAGAYQKEIMPHAGHIYALLERFRDTHRQAMPEAAASALNEFLRGHLRAFHQQPTGSDDSNLDLVKQMVPALACVRAEVNYLLSDSQAHLMRITERAFIHLQRSIVADGDARTKWQTAFESGETAAEKLGAVHLLPHGIWAFKANMEGERTDLVLGTPLRESELGRVAEAAEGLVLTEWKKVEDPRHLAQRAQDAYEQAQRYSRSGLAGFELTDRRYLVLVSQRDLHCDLPEDRTDGGVTYRHINIAADPEAPSRLRPAG